MFFIVPPLCSVQIWNLKILVTARERMIIALVYIDINLDTSPGCFATIRHQSHLPQHVQMKCPPCVVSTSEEGERRGDGHGSNVELTIPTHRNIAKKLVAIVDKRGDKFVAYFIIYVFFLFLTYLALSSNLQENLYKNISLLPMGGPNTDMRRVRFDGFISSGTPP